MEELAYGWMSLTGVLNTHMIAANLIERPAPPNSRHDGCRGMATGEPRARLRSPTRRRKRHPGTSGARPTRDGDEYVLNGTKMWVTNGERAGIVALAARTPEGITCFIVEKEPGPRSGASQ